MMQLLLILEPGMVYLLYTLIFTQIALILTLLFTVIMELDSLKLKQEGEGLLIEKIITGSLLLVLMVTIYSLLHITIKNPTEEVVKSMNILQISLIGILLFLVLMVDSLHHYIRGLSLLAVAMEAEKTQNRSFQMENFKSGKKLKSMVQEKDALRTKIKYLEAECEREENEADKARAEAEALIQVSAGFVEEYDRLLTDNQILRNQSKLVERRFTKQSTSHPHDKKNL